MANGSLTAHPGEYLKGDYSFNSISNATNPVGKGANNTTYANITLKTGENAETWVYWPFDISAIPSNATIDSVSCSAKAAVSDSHVKSRTIQLYSGATGKGSATNLTTSETAHNLDCGTWTRAELQDCRLRTYARRGASSTSTNRYLYFYGADLTVAYTYQSEKFMLKLGGAWQDIARVFKKVNGIWVEQTDLSSVIPGNVRYQNGGEYVSPNKTVTITGQGWINSGNTFLGVVINGVTYAQPATVEVDAGTVIQVISVGEVYLNGSVVVAEGESIYSHTVNENCTINLEINFNTYSAKATITTE